MTVQERMVEALRSDVLTGSLQPGEQVVQEAPGDGARPAQVFVITHEAREGDVATALGKIGALPALLAPPRLIRIVA